MLEPPRSTEYLGSWENPLGQYREVVGYSYLGSLFVRDPVKREYLVLHPLNYGNNARRYGSFDSTAEFESAVLRDAAFVEEILRPLDLAELEQRLGSLGPNQVYFPVPYPLIGGSGELATFQKGNVWVFADLVGQTLGVG
ncbi:MAG: T6SS immunity protein Tdi1 domain-containing protein [Dehalococcoidia bacterium]